MKVNFLKIHKDAVKPTKAHGSDFCYDCTATSITDLGDGRIQYGLGFGLQIDIKPNDNTSYGFDVRPRGSIHKTGLLLSNSIGTVDYDYTGQIVVVFYNILKDLPNYKVGDRVCQINIIKSENAEYNDVVEFKATERGDGKHGSSDVLFCK